LRNNDSITIIPKFTDGSYAMEPPFVVDTFQTDCAVCKSLGPIIFTGFRPISHAGRCYREVRQRKDGRLQSVEMFLFEIIDNGRNLKANLYDPDSEDLGLILSALNRSFLSHKARKALKQEIRLLPPKTLHRFFSSSHKERWHLFSLLDQPEVKRLGEYHKRNVKNRITLKKPDWPKSQLEKYDYRIHRFALFVFYFRKDLYKMGKTRHYFGQNAPSPIDVHGLGRAKSARDLTIVHHIKSARMIKGKTRFSGIDFLGSGSERVVRLSLRVTVQTKILEVCASATPLFSPKSHRQSRIDPDIRSYCLQHFWNNIDRWETLSRLTPHIVKPLHMSRYVKKSGEPGANVVMEYGEESLDSRIDQGKCSDQDFYDLLEGLSAVHAGGYYALDIKSENIVYVGGKIKFIDVGSALPIGVQSSAFIMTNGYQPVEFVRNEYAPRTPAADLFALGIVFYRMLYEQEPSFCQAFTLMGPRKDLLLAFERFHQNFQPDTQDVMGCLIKKMLCGNPMARISAREALTALSGFKEGKKKSKTSKSSRKKKKRGHDELSISTS